MKKVVKVLDLSIIIPLYNVEKYVVECIQSVVNQLDENMEVILINDGSTDRTEDLVQPFINKEKNIYYYKQENRGLSAARNRGLELAKGKYVFFLDSDDYISDDALITMLTIAKKYDADLVFANHYCFEDGEQFEKHDDNMSIKQYEKMELLSQILYTGTDADEKYVISCNKMMKKSLFDNCLFEIGKYHEDEYMIHHIYHKIKEAIYIDMCTYFIRVRQGSITHMGYNEKKIWDAIDFGYERMLFMKEFYPALYSRSIRAYAENITINYLMIEDADSHKELRTAVRIRMLKICPLILKHIRIKIFIRYFSFVISPNLYKKVFWE